MRKRKHQVPTAPYRFVIPPLQTKEVICNEVLIHKYRMFCLTKKCPPSPRLSLTNANHGPPALVIISTKMLMRLTQPPLNSVTVLAEKKSMTEENKL